MPAKQEPNIGINYGWDGGESGINLQLDENWRAIGALLQLSVVSKTDDIPETPSAGDRYIVPSGATGVWSGQETKVVRFNDGEWEAYTPFLGWWAYVEDENLFYHFNGTTWQPAPFLTAANTDYSNTDSGLSAEQVQAAIDELAATISSGGVADGGLQIVKLANLAPDPGNTTGLTFGVKAGRIRKGTSVVDVTATTVSLTASETNYVEVDAAGDLSTNTTGFSEGRIPLFTVLTDSTSIATIDDRRTWINLESHSRPAVNNQTGTSYSLVASDDNAVVRCSNAATVTVTVPANSSVQFPVGTIVQLRQVSSGQVVVSPGSGVTVNTPETLNTRKQGSTVALMKVATDEWDMTGDMETST